MGRPAPRRRSKAAPISSSRRSCRYGPISWIPIGRPPVVNAALAAGWGASWLTGWVAHERGFAAEAFDLAAGEWVAGLIHIGTEGSAPPERPRPDVAAITTWVDA